ncbi:MAG: M48 family metalloprotease [Pseudomonadota bacterium]
MKKTVNKTCCVILAWVMIIGLTANPALAISVGKEKELATEFMETLRNFTAFVQDPIILGLVRQIGKRIVAQLPPQPFDFNFYVVDSPEFNAFAGPGANIFVNRGLITALDNIDELAGILGHEIAHAACRHVSQMMDRSKIVNYGTLIGLLAGIILGVGGSGELGQAVMVGSAAGGLTTMLAYSRENEEEADRTGIGYIVNASFNPNGLLTGLEKIRNSDWYGMEKIPDYMKTHPGTTERIVYISSWIADHPEVLDAGRVPPIDPERFEIVKYRLAGMYGEEESTRKSLEQRLLKGPDKPVLHYGIALVLERQSRIPEAVEQLKIALSQKSFDPYLLLEIGRLYALSGEPGKALDILENLKAEGDVALTTLFYRGIARLDLGRQVKARSDFESVIRKAPDAFPKVFYQMARLEGEQGNSALSHFYLGKYYAAVNDLDNAIVHFNRSLKNLADPEKVTEAQALLEKLKEKKEERQ